MSVQSSFIQTKRVNLDQRPSLTAPKLIEAETDLVDRTKPNNKPALDHHPNIDGFMFMELYTYTLGSEM